MFEHHLPAKYKDIAPRIEHMRRRHRRVEVPRLPHPERRAQRGGRPPARGIRDGPDELRRAAPRHLRRERARARHVGQRPARLAQLPVAARLRGPALRPRSKTRTPRSRSAARTTTGTSTSGAAYAPERFIPLAIPPIWDPQAIADEVRRVAKKGCHAITFPENPVPLGLPSLHTDHWDPFWQACTDDGTVVCMHIGSSGKLAITAPDAPIDVLINLQPMNIVQAAADLIVLAACSRKFPDVTDRAVGRRDRLDPLLPRAHRPHATRCTRRGRSPTSATSCRARCSWSA